jgi:hypothetical protein
MAKDQKLLFEPRMDFPSSRERGDLGGGRTSVSFSVQDSVASQNSETFKRSVVKSF